MIERFNQWFDRLPWPLRWGVYGFGLYCVFCAVVLFFGVVQTEEHTTNPIAPPIVETTYPTWGVREQVIGQNPNVATTDNEPTKTIDTSPGKGTRLVAKILAGLATYTSQPSKDCQEVAAPLVEALRVATAGMSAKEAEDYVWQQYEDMFLGELDTLPEAQACLWHIYDASR